MEPTAPHNLEISALKQKTADADLDAFNQLVLQYQDLAFNRAYRILRDDPAAEDATQESFIKAFQNMPYFRGGSFRAWLLKIVTNTCYDYLRRGKQHLEVALYPDDRYGNEIESPAWISDPQVSVQKTVEAKELSKILNRKLEEIPRSYRDILLLVDAEELEYAEAAQVMNIPIGTVKSRLARGRLLLKERLSGIAI